MERRASPPVFFELDLEAYARIFLLGAGRAGRPSLRLFQRDRLLERQVLRRAANLERVFPRHKLPRVRSRIVNG